MYFHKQEATMGEVKILHTKASIIIEVIAAAVTWTSFQVTIKDIYSRYPISFFLSHTIPPIRRNKNKAFTTIFKNNFFYNCEEQKT